MKKKLPSKPLNRNLTKKDICDRMAVSIKNGDMSIVQPMVETFLGEIIRAMAEGFRIEIRGFGCFKPVLRAARLGRNPRTGEEVHIPEKLAPYFKFSREANDNFFKEMSLA